MSDKKTLQNLIQDSELTDDLKTDLLTELDKYPDEMSDDQLQKFDKTMAEVQEEGLATANILEEFADGIDTLEESVLSANEKRTDDTIKAMHRGLSQAQSMVDATVAE